MAKLLAPSITSKVDPPKQLELLVPLLDAGVRQVTKESFYKNRKKDPEPQQCSDRRPIEFDNVPVTHIPRFLTPEQCDALRQEAKQYHFERPQVHIYGKSHIIPRAQVWFGEEGCDYRYSGLLISPTPLPKYAKRLRDKIIRELGGQYNSLLVNRYRDGREHMGWHSDDEPELAPEADIVSVTIGAKRDFVVRNKVSQAKYIFPLEEGDLLIMHAPMQKMWQHALPKRLKVDDERLNYTFRHLIPYYHEASFTKEYKR